MVRCSVGIATSSPTRCWRQSKPLPVLLFAPCSPCTALIDGDCVRFGYSSFEADMSPGVVGLQGGRSAQMAGRWRGVTGREARSACSERVSELISLLFCTAASDRLIY
jgi:hypothetical protein